jgi:2-desacetyl-2-hydroxyethyl bacteriochlorophyllide A dehydrogenase
MTAAVAEELPARSLKIGEVPVPVIDLDTELLVEVAGCGICGTDLHILAGTSYRPVLPFVLGHEPVGRVVATGSAATMWLGKRVSLTLFTGCGRCALCRRGDERLCQDLVSVSGVLNAWGGYAQYMKIHKHQAVEVPDELTDIEAASLVDAGPTAVNAVRQSLESGPRTALVVGAAPIAFLCAELLRLNGVSTRVLARNQVRREMLSRLGHDVVSSFQDLDQLFDVVIDCAGVPEVTAPSLAVLAPKGAYVLAGYAKIPELDLAVAARKELRILGVRSGTRADLEASLKEAATGRMRLPEISASPLADINTVLEDLRHGRIVGKAVIVPPRPTRLTA